jgi:hypothetical protein
MAFSGGLSPSAFTGLISNGNIVKSPQKLLWATPRVFFSAGW